MESDLASGSAANCAARHCALAGDDLGDVLRERRMRAAFAAYSTSRCSSAHTLQPRPAAARRDHDRPRRGPRRGATRPRCWHSRSRAPRAVVEVERDRAQQQALGTSTSEMPLRSSTRAPPCDRRRHRRLHAAAQHQHAACVPGARPAPRAAAMRKPALQAGGAGRPRDATRVSRAPKQRAEGIAVLSRPAPEAIPRLSRHLLLHQVAARCRPGARIPPRGARVSHARHVTSDRGAAGCVA